MAGETMARFVVSKDDNGRDLESVRAIDFDELKAEFRKAAEGFIEGGGTVHEQLRQELPVYKS